MDLKFNAPIWQFNPEVFTLKMPRTCSQSSLLIRAEFTSPGFIEHFTRRFCVSSVTASKQFSRFPTKKCFDIVFQVIFLLWRDFLRGLAKKRELLYCLLWLFIKGASD